MQIHSLIDKIKKQYNFNVQADWDISGVHIFKDEINNILISLDITDNTIEYCIENKIDLIISHHPLFVDNKLPEMQLSTKYFYWLKELKINLIFLHTTFDFSLNGMNHRFLENLGLEAITYGKDTNTYVVGSLKNETTVDELSHLIKSTYSLDFIKYSQKYADKKIKKVGFCSGSGASLIYELNDKIDAFITGDVKYHAWIDADALGIILIDINHNIENMFVDIILEYLQELNFDLNLYTIKSDLSFRII